MSNNARAVAFLSTGRQDWGILRSTVLLAAGGGLVRPLLWVGGMHLKSRFGRSVDLIRREGLPIDRELDFLAEPPCPSADAANAIRHVRRAIEADAPKALVLVGDRSETLAAAIAATLSRLPIIHLHGGEESEGAMDNAFRHAVTKLSHLHLVSHSEHARRVLQMGEDPGRVVIVGAPGQDNLYRADLPDRETLERELGRSLPDPVVLVTMHPTTLGEDPAVDVAEVAAAMERVAATYVVTAPNADEGGASIRQFWRQWSRGRANVVTVDTLGEQRYWGILRLAAAMLGNSSSGIVEAPAAGIAVVNVGDRQRGRLRWGGIRDVPARSDAIAQALTGVLDPSTRDLLRTAPSPYPSGPAAPRVLAAIEAFHPQGPPRKAFHDLVWPSGG